MVKKEKARLYAIEYRKKNRAKCTAYNKEWCKNNPELTKAQQQRSYYKNKKSINKANNESRKALISKNPIVKLRIYSRNRIYGALKYRKWGKTTKPTIQNRRLRLNSPRRIKPWLT